MFSKPVLYPAIYPWYVLMGFLDVIVTTVILAAGGEELNTVAAGVISRFGVPGMVAMKLLSIILVVVICEFVGARRPRVGLNLARTAVALSSAPIFAAAAQFGACWMLLGRVWMG